VSAADHTGYNRLVSSDVHPVSARLRPGPVSLCAALDAAAESWQRMLGERLISLVLFGSLARGDAQETSDIDLLVVADGFPRSLSARRRLLLDEWDRVRSERRLSNVEWNLVAKTPEEAGYHSPLYLDIVEDGVLLFDRGRFFAAVLDAMRARMRGLGSRRVYLPDGTWYWDLKPDFRFGEVVEI
jgi:predicted nucleotidyltransferase